MLKAWPCSPLWRGQTARPGLIKFKMSFDLKKTSEALVSFLKTTFTKAEFSRGVIGLSGGVDSATSCALAVRAIGAENVYPVLLPHGGLSTQGVIDAMGVIEFLKIPLMHVVRVDIKPAVDAIVNKEPVDDVRRGNVMARVRMIYLFDQAKKRGALVVGTENKSEHYLGYYTRFGDEASDIEPLRNLYKTQVYELARYLGVPEAVLVKPPTAGLWAGQTDEGELGFSYGAADKVLTGLIDEGKAEEELVNSGFDRNLVMAVVARVRKNEFKHELPYIAI